MKLYFRFLFAIVIWVVFCDQYLFSQVQLIQSFSEENSTGNSFFGRSVSKGGDLNNDGVNDIAVGASGHNSNMGRVHIYFGGSSVDEVVDVVLDGENQNDFFGQSVATGDFNGDGIDDLIVGANGYQGSKGRVYLYYGGVAFDNIADLILTGENFGDEFGFAVSTAGNVNNDNFDEIMIGARGFNGRRGKVYIYFGGNPVNSFVNVTLSGENGGDNFGHSIASAGDINNDNYDDVIVGAYGYNTWTGKAYVFFGGSSMNNVPDLTMDGENTNDQFGFSVSDAGKVNNDVFDDVIIGAIPNSAMGKVYLFHGGSTPDNVPDLTLVGTTSRFGYAISSAGDINNDNFDDLLVGDLIFNTATGKSFIFYGGPTMDILPDLTLEGEDLSNLFGNSVANLGDVNDDGIDDLIIAAHQFKGSTGKVYILYGSTVPDNLIDLSIKGPGANNNFGNSVANAGDINNDGFMDILVSAGTKVYLFLGGSQVSTSPFLEFSYEGILSFFGLPASSAGDVNNDGFDDIIIGSSGDNSHTGKADIYLGGNSMDDTPDIVLNGFFANSYFGKSVSNAGDVNNDNYDDVIVGMNGRVYLYLGGSSMDNVSDLLMTGTIPTRFGESVSYAGDVNSDGYDDIIMGDISMAESYIYFGGDPMNNVADVTLSVAGKAIASARDINNDGFDDIIIGHDGTNNPAVGTVSIFYGGNPMDTNPDIGFQLFELNTVNKFGYSISAIDINHDNFTDVVVGASGYNNDAGRVFIYYGSSSMDNFVDIILDGENIGDNFGVSVSNVGDVNYDGYDDLLIGANTFPLNGKAYLYSASSAPLYVVRANVKIFLEGPYFSNIMNSTLDLSNTLIQPYHNLPWNYLGGETTTQSFVMNNNIVDWVLLELRTGATASDANTVVSTRAALLRNDGVVLDTDGSEFIAFPQVNPGSYYITVYHRNHLPIIGNQAVSLTP